MIVAIEAEARAAALREVDAATLKEAMLAVGPIGGMHRIDFQQAFAVTDLSQQQLAMMFAEAVVTAYRALLDAEPAGAES
jgi:hypothetical protein